MSFNLPIATPINVSSFNWPDWVRKWKGNWKIKDANPLNFTKNRSFNKIDKDDKNARFIGIIQNITSKSQTLVVYSKQRKLKLLVAFNGKPVQPLNGVSVDGTQLDPNNDDHKIKWIIYLLHKAYERDGGFLYDYEIKEFTNAYIEWLKLYNLCKDGTCPVSGEIIPPTSTEYAIASYVKSQPPQQPPAQPSAQPPAQPLAQQPSTGALGFGKYTLGILGGATRKHKRRKTQNKKKRSKASRRKRNKKN